MLRPAVEEIDDGEMVHYTVGALTSLPHRLCGAFVFTVLLHGVVEFCMCSCWRSSLFLLETMFFLSMLCAHFAFALAVGQDQQVDSRILFAFRCL